MNDIENTRKSKTRLYHIWTHIKSRCNNPNATEYENYGGRGITICPEWEKDFDAFEEWAYSNGYREYLTIDRIDNDKGYSPDNCRWATMYEQAQNRRPRHKGSAPPQYDVDGILHTAKEWAEIIGISEQCFYLRWTAGKRGSALFAPARKKERI